MVDLMVSTILLIEMGLVASILSIEAALVDSILSTELVVSAVDSAVIMPTVLQLMVSLS